MAKLRPTRRREPTIQCNTRCLTMRINELVFEITGTPDGGYDARAVGHSMFTQGSDWADLEEMVRDAVLCHFDHGDSPAEITFLVSTDEANA